MTSSLGGLVKHSDELWAAIQRVLRRDRWTRLADLYRGVARLLTLDPDDFEPQAPGSEVPKWQRNVRNVLQTRKGIGHVLWNGAGQYKLP
jgi:hypothetical protein